MSEEVPAWLATEEELAAFTPPRPATPLRMKRWVKVFRWKVAEAVQSAALPTVMRLWLSGLERCDSEGRADYGPGELAEILACSDRAVRRAIAQAKDGGLLLDSSDARHLYLLGAKDEAPSAKRTAKRRRLEAVGQRYKSSRPRSTAAPHCGSPGKGNRSVLIHP